MMTFVTLSALLVVAALLLAAGPLIRRRGGKVSREAVDAVAVTRARQLAELEQELEDGDIDNRTYELSRRQIESEASDRQADAESGPAIQTGKPVSAIVLAVLLPLATLGIYLQVGDPDAIDRGSMNPMAGGDMDMAAAVDALESRLAQQPDDLEGWMLLGRSRISLGQYDQAVEAYRQAVEIAGEDNPRVLANYAEAITLADPSRMVTHAAPLFRHVLDLDPSHPKGLWYGGLITMEEGDPESAVALWERLLDQDPPDAFRQVVEERIAVASGEEGELAVTEGEENGAAVTVEVELAEQFQDDIDGSATVFLIARPAQAADAPPLAGIRLTAAALPGPFRLGDENAMLDGHQISQHERVEIIARVSESGDATPRPGDIIGTTTVELDNGSGEARVLMDHRME